MVTDQARSGASTAEVDSSRSWWMCAAAFASMFAVFGVAYSFGAFFDSMSAEFDAGSGLTSLFFSVTTFLYFTLGVFTGSWSDRIGPTRVLLTGAVFLGAGLLATAAAPSLWVGLVTYSIGVGVAVACGYVPMVAVVGGWFERRRTLALGVAVAGIGMGTLVMAPVASWLIDQVGWRDAYRIYAVGGAMIMVLCAVVARRPPLEVGHVPPIALGEAARSKAFRVLYGSALLMSLTLFVPFVFLADYAEGEGISDRAAALLVGVIGGSSIVGRLGLGTLAPRLGLVRVYQGCFGVMAASFAVWLVAGGSYALLMVFVVVLGVAYGGFIALSPAVAAAAFGTAGLGGVLGALYTSAGVGGLIGPPLAGATIDGAGYTTAIVSCIVLTSAAFAVLLRLPLAGRH